MVKLAAAREIRTYGPHRVRNRWEYINAGVYLFAAVLLLGGLAAQLSPGGDATSGLVVVLMALALFSAVNVHDLIAHLAGVDYCLAVVLHDVQLGLVEFAAPVVELLGSLLNFAAVLLLFVQMEKGFNYRRENHAVNLLIAGSTFWVIGSIHDMCQYYERSGGHVQILQKSVQIPFLMGSFLFLVASIFNHHEIFGSIHHQFKITGVIWVWLCMFGALFFLVGGTMNVVKVFKMQQMEGMRLEKLRGGALERLCREREGRVPLILEENNRRRRAMEEPGPQPPVSATTYKDVLIGQS